MTLSPSIICNFVLINLEHNNHAATSIITLNSSCNTSIQYGEQKALISSTMASLQCRYKNHHPFPRSFTGSRVRISLFPSLFLPIMLLIETATRYPSHVVERSKSTHLPGFQRCRNKKEVCEEPPTSSSRVWLLVRGGIEFKAGLIEFSL